MINSQSELNIIHQSCFGCVFADYKDYTQTGCQLNRIQGFKNLGYEIVEAYNLDKNFFIINGRKCKTFRTHKWAQNKQDIIDIVKKEIATTLELIFFIRDDLGTAELLKTLIHIKMLQVPPNHITFVIMNGVTAAEIKKIFSGIQIPYSITYINERDHNNNVPDVWRCLDIAIKNVKQEFYSCYDIGHILNFDLLNSLDQMINDRLVQITGIYKQNHNGLLLNTKVHNSMNGSRVTNILEQLKLNKESGVKSIYDETNSFNYCS